MIVRLLSLLLVAQAQTQTPAPSFAKTVLRNFEIWDVDRNGSLTEAEVDQAALSPKFHGEDAAALAALHGWLFAVKGDTPPLTKAWFEAYKPVPLCVARKTLSPDLKTARKEYATTPGSLQSSFTGGLKRLSKAHSRTLFTPEGPELSDIRQGALGDCFMLAPLGALVHRDPQSVQHMIKPDKDGYEVDFGDGKVIRVGAPTDAELAMGGSATGEGLWIRVVEKAYGSRKLKEGEDAIVRDGMNGGNSGVAGRAFTGHSFMNVKLIGDYKKDVPETDLSPKLDRLREEIPQAISEKRLVLAGTPKKDMPKSISPNHAYAVFGYDPATDRVTLWNPHGDDFKPKGDEGIENGYARKDGVFSMPLTTFVRTFGRIFFEEKS